MTTAEDVRIAARRASLGGDETVLVQRWIAVVERMIADRLGPLEALDSDALALVVSEVVADRLTSPGRGVTATQVAVDDSSTSVRYDTADTGWFRITAAHWDLLAPDRGRESEAFSINPAYQAGRHAAW